MDPKAFDRLVDQVDRIRTEDIPTVRTEIALLKLKASMWGGLTGVVTGGFVVALKLFA